MTEPEVEATIAGWFQEQGYSVTRSALSEAGVRVDLIAVSKAHEWRVEAKGDYDKEPAQYTVNFDTAVGQLLKSMTRRDERTKYGLAMPISRTERRERLSYRNVLPKYAKSVAFDTLGIHLLLVRGDRSVEVVLPDDVCRFCGSLASQAR